MRPKRLECKFKKRKHGSKCKGPGVGRHVAGLRKRLRTLWLGCREGVGGVEFGLLGSKCCGKSLRCVKLDRNTILYPPHPLFFLLSLNTGSLLRTLPSAFSSGAYFFRPHPPYCWVGQVSSSFLLALSSHSSLKLPSFEGQVISL